MFEPSNQSQLITDPFPTSVIDLASLQMPEPETSPTSTGETPSTSEIVLSEQQRHAVNLIQAWIARSSDDGDLEFRLGGYAGTGKTTLLKYLIEKLNMSVAVAAFTGKAVSVLRRKGIGHAQTLHSLLYQFEYDVMTRKFVQIPRISMPDVDLVIVDEASMVSTELYSQLRRHDIPVLYVGDPAQLEPVGDNPNLMRSDVNYTLTEIHRQAAGNPILRLAGAVRQGLSDIPTGEWVREQGSLLVTRKRANPSDFNVALCSKNATRHLMNGIVRNRRGYTGVLQEGETVICLKNNRDYQVFNGMILTVQKIGRSKLMGGEPVTELDLKDDLGVTYHVPALMNQFGKDSMQTFGKAVPFDYGYALTVHKSQGSEWDDVLVIDERLYKTDHARLRYTAFTRAAKTLTVCL